jgi:hypothetical protein
VNGEEAETGLLTLSIANALVDCCCDGGCTFAFLANGFVDWRVGGKEEEIELPVGVAGWRKGLDEVCCGWSC